MIDFTSTFNEITIIIDQDDSNQRGLQHAHRILQQIIPNLPPSSPHSLWNFGLYKYSLTFPHSITCDLLKLYPESINEENRPFWLMFSRPPSFRDPLLKIKPLVMSEAKYCGLTGGVAGDLTYGAMTGMNRFFFEKSAQFRKRDRWTFRFHNEFFELQTMECYSRPMDDQRLLRLIKRKIPLDIIDRVAIVHLWNDGFCLYLNMKGNVHEFHKDWIRRDTQDSPDPFKRQGLNGSMAKPLFTTIRLRIYLKEEKDLIKDLEHQMKKQTETTKVEKSIQTLREESLNEIRELLKNLLEFFYRNRVHVCFAGVSSKDIFGQRLETLHSYCFPSFIQNYSWSMLLSISFRLEALLYQCSHFISILQQYSRPNDDETIEQVDDRFYRLCIYLYRRSSEYIFLDLDQEIRIGITLHEEKMKRFRENRVKTIRFDEATKSTAYIPSVIITPTTISIRPLKLCKLNRVLREPRFGGYHNFTLVELRDEAQRLLFATEYRSLKQQIENYLVKGFHVIVNRVYKYLHHSQSQVKSKQFWFYYAEQGFLSHDDAYTWMGNFDKERVVAKHTARIALCFTSSEKTIQVIHRFSLVMNLLFDFRSQRKQWVMKEISKMQQGNMYLVMESDESQKI